MSDLISRQAAIKILHEALDAADQIADVPFGVYQNYRDKMNKLPPALPEPMKIDLSRCSEENWERIKKEWANTPITTIAAEPERIRGRWIPVGGALYQCDQCGVVSLKRKFCSECGADMREVTI